MPEYDFRWVIEEPVKVTQLTDKDYRIERTTEVACFALSFATGELEREVYFNGEYVDVGDDLMAFLSLIDDYHEQGGVIDVTRTSRPYDGTETCF